MLAIVVKTRVIIYTSDQHRGLNMPKFGLKTKTKTKQEHYITNKINIIQTIVKDNTSFDDP